MTNLINISPTIIDATICGIKGLIHKTKIFFRKLYVESVIKAYKLDLVDTMRHIMAYTFIYMCYMMIQGHVIPSIVVGITFILISSYIVTYIHLTAVQTVNKQYRYATAR